MKIGRYILLALFLLPLLVSCGGRDADRIELERIDSLASNRQPRHALELLDSIDARSLSEPNQNLYELLRIKARDKDFLKHRSNTTILRLVDYYRDHQSEGRYPEALYYAGRVHFDLGDYPSALKYFYQSLELLDDSKKNLRLKSVVNSQIGDLLCRMRLYEQAISYFNKVDEIFQLLNDSIGIMNNYEALGIAYLRKKDFGKSEALFNKASKMALNLIQEQDIIRQQMNLAGVELGRKNIPKALNLIRDVPNSINRDDYDVAIGYAADIYLQAGIMDTALYYTEKLKDIKGDSQKLGFQLLLKYLTDRIEQDSIVPYVKKYTDVMEGFVRKNADEAALLQHSVYNYSVLEKERDKANQNNQKLKWIIISLVIIVMIAFTIIIIFYISIKKLKSEVKSLCKENKVIKMSLHPSHSKETSESFNNTESISPDRNLLINVILEQIPIFSENTELQSDFNKKLEEIRSTDVYKEIIAKEEMKMAIPDNSSLWNRLDKTVTNFYPSFRYRYNILMQGKSKPEYYRLALLIKCGITPQKSAVLMHISSSGVTYRKNALCKALFGKAIKTGNLEKAIFLL
ncbi:MAG: tetratricopeptide repeat protein [Muribaculaceae bacterium]|nr:tetratricopeptide repeat protein [Muribaculaceae bacterium]